MNATINRLGRRVGTIACALGASAALLAPTAALANNMTEVTVQADMGNIQFEVPTVFPFAVQPDGSLKGPDPETYCITNKSSYGVHVTGMTIEASEPWTIVSDATSSEEDNSIDFQLGPEGELTDACQCVQSGGTDLSHKESWDMGYAGSDTDKLPLFSDGDLSHPTVDLSKSDVTVATITWTIQPGQHVSD